MTLGDPTLARGEWIWEGVARPALSAKPSRSAATEYARIASIQRAPPAVSARRPNRSDPQRKPKRSAAQCRRQPNPPPTPKNTKARQLPGGPSCLAGGLGFEPR